MKLKLKDADLTGEEMTIVADPKQRQLISYEINEKEALQLFKGVPWAKVLVTPKFYFFRE